MQRGFNVAMEQCCERHKIDIEKWGFVLFLVFMTCYYGWRMFALTPWYDELYTYYYFISRGPVYAAGVVWDGLAGLLLCLVVGAGAFWGHRPKTTF